ncbi:MAG: MBL fold metallo-hydrolase, partial [Chlorobiales bacterium]|nr:MBL fold metallo-hydrolase [Chlorobiales bacterium]
KLVKIKPGDIVKLAKDLQVEVIEIPHRAEYTDTLAFIAKGKKKRILYLPDIDRWEQLKPSIEEILSKVDIALIDGTFYSSDELPGRDMSKIPHPPIVESMNRFSDIAANGKTQIVFTHLNSSNLVLEADGIKLKNLRSRGFDIAYDGMRFDL